LQISSRFLRN